VNLIPGSKSPT